MAEVVVDTNVLLCASAADDGSPFDDAAHVTPDDQLVVHAWLSAFRADPERLLVLDEAFKIYEEYRNKLTDQDYGLLAIKDKLETACFVPVEYDSDGCGVVPDDLAALDASDRKLAAAAVNVAILFERRCTIANAVDTDWYDVETELDRHGVTVEQVLAAYCHAKYVEKKARRAK